jgi:hypothetical protein
MLVTERMQALGYHARSSRQPPLKERRPPNAIDSPAEQDVVDETVLENGAAQESVAAPIVDHVPAETVVHENGNGAVAEITPDEEAAVRATVAAVLAKFEPQPATADDTASQTTAAQDDEALTAQEDEALSAAKRAIIHEWQNWSALHSDELDHPNVAQYFFEHLEKGKSHLLHFAYENKAKFDAVKKWVSRI